MEIVESCVQTISHTLRRLCKSFDVFKAKGSRAFDQLVFQTVNAQDIGYRAPDTIYITRLFKSLEDKRAVGNLRKLYNMLFVGIQIDISEIDVTKFTRSHLAKLFLYTATTFDGIF